MGTVPIFGVISDLFCLFSACSFNLAGSEISVRNKSHRDWILLREFLGPCLSGGDRQPDHELLPHALRGHHAGHATRGGAASQIRLPETLIY